MSAAPAEDLVALADAHLRTVLTDPRASRADKMAAALAVARRIPIAAPPKSSGGGGGALHLHFDADGQPAEAPRPTAYAKAAPS